MIESRKSMSALFRFLAAGLCLVAALPAAAQSEGAGAAEGSDEAATLAPVTVTATRSSRGRPKTAIPGSVTIIEREELVAQSRITADLGEILADTVPGLGPSTQSLTNFGQQLRGRDFLILIDGVPQTTPLRAVSKQLRTISPASIERVEVIRGAVATYGFGATGGIINIVTRSGESVPEGRRLSTGFGATGSLTHPSDSLGGYLQQAVSGRSGDTDYRFSLHAENTGGGFNADGRRIAPDAYGQGGGRDDSTELDFQMQLGHQLTGDQHLRLSLSRYRIIQDSELVTDDNPDDPAFGVPGPPKGTDPGIRNTSVSLDHEWRRLAGGTLSTQLYYQDYETRFSFFEGYATGPGQSELVSEKVGLRLAHDRGLWGGASIVYGLDALRDETAQPLLDGRTSVPPIEQLSYAPFAQIEQPLGSRLLLRGGVRHEHVALDVPTFTNETADPNVRTQVAGGSLDYDETVFNIGAVLDITAGQELFAAFSQGFSVADVGRVLRTISGSGSADSVAAINPEAQVVDNYELGWRGSFARFSAEASVFLTTSDLGATFDEQLNISRQKEEIYGIELSGDWQLHRQLTLGGSLSLQEGEADTDGDGSVDAYLPATRISPPKGTLHLKWRAADGGWDARLQATHFADRDRSPYIGGFGSNDIDGYTLVDAATSLALGPGRLSVGIDNLLNEDYLTATGQVYGSFQQGVPGRGASLRVGYSVDY
jgi:iron complex outermembrane receptor protein